MEGMYTVSILGQPRSQQDWSLDVILDFPFSTKVLTMIQLNILWKVDHVPKS